MTRGIAYNYDRASQINPQNPAPIQNLRENVQKLLDNKDCADAVQKLLDVAAQMLPKWQGQNSKSFMEAFDRIASQGGYVASMPAGTSHYGGTVGGDAFASLEGHGARPAVAYLHPFNYFGRLNNVQAQQYYAFNALHETFHLAARGGYSDQDMARVVAEITGWRAPEKGSPVERFSQFWDQYLGAHCRPK